MIYSNILTTPSSADSTAEEEAKALPAFHPLPYYSFIPAMLIMVLRLALDVLTKLLILAERRGE